MADGLHQVGLAEPGGAVDEERVVGLAGRLGDGVRGGGGELVRLADDEGVEGVALVERLGRGIGHSRRAGQRRRRRDEEVHLGPGQPLFVDPEDHRHRSAEGAFGEPGEQRGVLGFVPLHGELVGHAQDQPVVLERDRLGGLEPGLEILLGDFAPGVVQNACPGFFGRQLHADFVSLIALGMFWGRRSYGSMWKSQP